MDEYTAVVKLLKKVKDRKFAESALEEELTARRDYNLYCYRASYKLYVAPEGDVEDAMFWDFARNIDLNDIANARSGLTELVLVWDMQSAHIERSDLNVLKELARRVSNQEVLDCLSGECMYSALLNETAVESLEETYALFTRICRDTATLQDMEQAYESKITGHPEVRPGQGTARPGDGGPERHEGKPFQPERESPLCRRMGLLVRPLPLRNAVPRRAGATIRRRRPPGNSQSLHRYGQGGMASNGHARPTGLETIPGHTPIPTGPRGGVQHHGNPPFHAVRRT